MRRRGAGAGGAPITGASLDLEGVDALAFTSAKRSRPSRRYRLGVTSPVFTVGAATASRARAAGFGDVRSADGGAGALAALIGRRTQAQTGAASRRAGTGGRSGGAAGRARRRGPGCAVYETHPTDLTAPPADIDAVMVHSARGPSGSRPFSPASPPRHRGFRHLRAAAAALRSPPRARHGCALSNEAALLDFAQMSRPGIE